MSNILIVDDNPSRFEGVIARLEQLEVSGSNISVAGSVRDAIGWLHTRKFNVLVVDMLLPETPWGQPVDNGGAQLLTHIDEDPDIKKPNYIIGITAAVNDDPEVQKVFSSKAWLLLKTSGSGGKWEEQLTQLIEHAFALEKTQDSVEYGVDVCFMAALKTPEFEALLDTQIEFEDPKLVDTTTYARSGRLSYADGSLAVIAASCLRMGSTESALLASKMIREFRPRLLILIGICAGFEEKVEYGDVIVADPCWDYTSAKIASEPDGKKVVTYSPDYVNIDTDIRSRFELLSGDDAFLHNLLQSWKGDKPRATPAIRVAPSATGPAVVADANVMLDIRRQQNRNTIGLEMEAYGVYCAARMATRPRPLVVSAKSVCDFGTFLKDDKYQKYAAYVSANVAVEFCRRYGADIKLLTK